jgi:hypothetical protein
LGAGRDEICPHIEVMMRTHLTCRIVLACLFLAFVTASAIAAGDHPNFSGHWRLNTFLSDDPMEKIHQAAADMMRAERISERGTRHLDPSGAAARERRRARAARNQPEEVEIHLHDLNLSSVTLKITHEEPRLTILYSGGMEETVFTDGRVEKNEFGYGSVEIRAHWKKKNKLVVKSKSDSGPTTTHKYELALEGKQLKLVTSVANQRPAPSFSFVRYYDLMPPEDSATAD